MFQNINCHGETCQCFVELVLGFQPDLVVPHTPQTLLLTERKLHFFGSQLISDDIVTLSHITIHHGNTLILPLTCPLPEDRKLYDDLIQSKELSIPHSNLVETPIENPGLLLFVDDKIISRMKTGGYQVGYVATNLNFPLEYSLLTDIN